MTRTYDRDFRHLLVHLVPRHRLSPTLRRDVDRALRGGGERELRWQSLRALEALCDADFLRRERVTRDDGRVVVGYQRSGGRYHLNVALPLPEWEQWRGQSGTPADAGRAVADISTAPPGETAARPLDAAAPVAPIAPDSVRPSDATEFLPDIVRSLAISDRSAPVLERLDLLLETLERWLGVTSGGLDVLEHTLVVGSDEEGARVRVVSDAELRASEWVRRAIESGTRRLVPAASLGGPEPGGDPDAMVGVAPIFAFGKVVGVLRMRFASDLDRAAMDARLDAAASVLRNVIEFNYQFESLTSIDSLTGVYNRQFFDRQLPVEIERAMRSGSALSMLMIDVDDFKRVNDELGHKKGDEALIAVTEIIRRNLRKIDLPFRYGGEEIVVLLPGTPEFEALHTAERLRRVIHQYRGFRDAQGKPRDLSVSIGVSVYPDTAKSGEQLFAQADEAMYRAKQRGKNQVVLFSSV